MRIKQVKTDHDFTLYIESENGIRGLFDVKPYLELEAFELLKEQDSFQKITNGGYFIEWDCGADLSADTIEARMKIL